MAERAELGFGVPGTVEWGALGTILGQALHFEPGRMAYWMEGIGATEFRVVRAAGMVVGGLGLLPMGQWFGGRRVPVAGISSVGIAPEWRGRGAASALLRATLAELRRAGTALAVLYPSTLPVYRKAGFERAGSALTYGLPLAGLELHGPLELEPVTEEGWDGLATLRAGWARGQDGTLDRSAFIWRRILAPFGQTAYTYRIVRDGVAEGYVVYTQAGREAPLQVLDWCVLNREAGLTLLAFLGGYRAMVTTTTLRGIPDEPLLHLLPERVQTIERAQTWLLRIVDVAGALGGRGYHPALDAELHLAVADDLLPENAGAWTLRVGAGRGEVARGGAGRLRLDVRALAALYSGFLSARQLASLGALDGPEEELLLAELLFGGSRPAMAEMF